MFLDTDDLLSLSHISRALWVDTKQGNLQTGQTLSAISYLDLTTERLKEKAALALLVRAEKDENSTLAEGLNYPFYRLSPRERFILSVLHKGHWSYRRLSGMLGITNEQLQEIAWKARLHIASSSPSKHGFGATYAPTKLGSNCPDFNMNRPWTQKFLDEEITRQEKLFLQNHLIACHSCMRTLNHSRDLYYQVEKLIPHFHSTEDKNNTIKYLSQVLRAPMAFKNRSVFRVALETFFKRHDVWWAFLVFIVLSALPFFVK